MRRSNMPPGLQDGLRAIAAAREKLASKRAGSDGGSGDGGTDPGIDGNFYGDLESSPGSRSWAGDPRPVTESLLRPSTSGPGPVTESYQGLTTTGPGPVCEAYEHGGGGAGGGGGGGRGEGFTRPEALQLPEPPLSASPTLPSQNERSRQYRDGSTPSMPALQLGAMERSGNSVSAGSTSTPAFRPGAMAHSGNSVSAGSSNGVGGGDGSGGGGDGGGGGGGRGGIWSQQFAPDLYQTGPLSARPSGPCSDMGSPTGPGIPSGLIGHLSPLSAAAAARTTPGLQKNSKATKQEKPGHRRQRSLPTAEYFATLGFGRV